MSRPVHPLLSKAVQMVRAGATVGQAAQAFNLSAAVIFNAWRPRTGRPVHPDMPKAIEMVRGGASASEAARKFGFPVGSVWKACRNAGIATKGRRGRPMHPDMPKAVEMVRAGARVSETAFLFGLKPGAIYHACQKAGIAMHKRGRPLGSRKPLDPKWGRVDWARSNAQIARKLGVSGEYVRQMRLRVKAESAHGNPTDLPKSRMPEEEQ